MLSLGLPRIAKNGLAKPCTVLAFLGVLGVFSGIPAFASTIAVTNLADSGFGSLRAAIASASPGDTIDFSVTGTITLSSTLTIITNVTISGPAASSLFISGNHAVGVVAISGGVTANISGVTIQNGSAGANGGAIWNQGTLTISNSTLSGNSASRNGGGIYNDYGATLTINNSTLSGNSAGTYGGGLSNNGTETVTNSTLSGNSAIYGGGIYNGGRQTVTFSTLSGNSATYGGGIATFGTLTANKNTIMANSVSGGNCSNPVAFTSQGYNLSDDATCSFHQPGDQNSTNPLLGPLANNGGPTQTDLPLAGSPAIDAVPIANCTDANGVPITTDQRGVTRPQGTACDIGSVELAVSQPAVWTLTNPLLTARYQHAAAVLPSGKVLVEGGYAPGTRPLEVQIYDPTNGTWSTTTPLPAGHGSNAIRLSTGEILAVGDESLLGEPAHFYNESTATWTATGLPNVRRFAPGIALLPSGDVLMAGGYIGGCCYGAAGNYETAETYNRTANTWTPVGSMSTKRAGLTATLLPDGKVLAAGGYYRDTQTIWNSAEIYDPVAKTWSPAASMLDTRAAHTATLLPSGKVLVAGGDYTSFSTYTPTAELYDPAANTWSLTGPLSVARSNHTATLLPSGKVLVAGGINSSGTLSSTEIYDPATGVWAPGPDMNVARMWFTATLLTNGQVLAVAGYNPGTGVAAASAELYHTPTPAQLVLTAGLSRDGSRNIVVQGTLTNHGGTAASNVVVKSVKIGTLSATSLPPPIATIPAGGFSQFTVTIPGSSGLTGPSLLTVTATYTGGILNSNLRVTLP